MLMPALYQLSCSLARFWFLETDLTIKPLACLELTVVDQVDLEYMPLPPVLFIIEFEQ